MGIIADPEMYRTTEKHWAHHPLPNYPKAFEAWYNNGSYDNGYHSSLMWLVNEGTPMANLHICDPKGKLVVESIQLFDPGAWSASTETLDIKMDKNNYYRGKFPRYEHYVHDGNNNGVELVYESLTQPTLGELPDGAVIGRVSTPDTPVFFTWYFRPRCKITGKLIVAGKEIPVTGEGLSEHEWSSGNFLDTFQYWYFGCLPIGKHTLIYMAGHLSQKLGYQDAKFLWHWKGDKLYEYCRDGDYYIQASDLDIDKASGKIFPRKLVLIFDHSRIKGTVTCNFKALMQQLVFPGEGRDVLYSNCVYDCHAKMEIDKEKIDTKFSRILEESI